MNLKTTNVHIRMRFLRASVALLLGAIGLLCSAFRIESDTRGPDSAVQNAAAQGQGVSGVTPSAQELVQQYDDFADSIHVVRAQVFVLSKGTDDYMLPMMGADKITANVVMLYPRSGHVTGETALGPRSYFDAVTDGSTVKMLFPSLHTVFDGPVDATGNNANPLLEPGKVFEDFFWQRIPREPGTGVSVSKDSPNDAVVLTFNGIEDGKYVSGTVWFHQPDLQITRIETRGDGGVLRLRLTLTEWMPATRHDGGPELKFPRHIHTQRPGRESDIYIRNVSLNEELPSTQFYLRVPPGTRERYLSGSNTPTVP
jgi:hypothetical protein